MPEKTFKYKKKESGIFGKVKRPLIDIQIYSQIVKRFITIREVLADTGADVSLFPRDIGELIVSNYTSGKYIEIQGIAPFSKLIAFIHKIKIRINNMEFISLVAIADSSDVPPILGRVRGLDLFEVLYSKGKKVEFSE